jgi:hypothetical protein
MLVFSGAGRSCRGLCGRSRFNPRTATVTFSNAGGKIMRFGFTSRSAILYAEGGETRVSLRGLARSAQRRLIRARSSIGKLKQTGEFHISKCTENAPKPPRNSLPGAPRAPRKSRRHRPCSAPAHPPAPLPPARVPARGPVRVKSGSSQGPPAALSAARSRKTVCPAPACLQIFWPPGPGAAGKREVSQGVFLFAGKGGDGDSGSCSCFLRRRPDNALATISLGYRWSCAILFVEVSPCPPRLPALPP